MPPCDPYTWLSIATALQSAALAWIATRSVQERIRAHRSATRAQGSAQGQAQGSATGR
jgi:peptidoglycan/LPS O-acetylase OafA/YrhL